MKNLLIALSALLVVALMTVGLVLAFTPDSHTHEYTSQVDVAATCTANGKLLYTCACGHSYAEKIDALGHSFTNYVSDNNTTCIADGTLTAKCDRCDATDTKVDEGSMLPHTYDSYANNGDDHTKSCSCGASITESHIWEETAKVYPTHTEEGSADYACVCGATKHEVLDMLVGCDYNQEVEYWLYLCTPATCTEAATYYKSCICGEYSEEAELFTVGEPNGHSNEPWTLVSVDAQAQTAVLSYVCWNCDEDVILNITFADCEKSGTPATCDADGLETVTYVYYIGADEHELVVYSGVIEALGHDYSAPAYTWSDDYTTCTATMTCANDPAHVISENANVTSKVTAPNCFVEGYTTYTAAFTNSTFATQTQKTDTTAKVAAHNWNGTTCTICGGTKFEAETFEFINPPADKGVIGDEGKGAAGTNYPSGDAFIYNLQYAIGSTIKVEVESEINQKAVLNVCMGRRQYVVNFADIFTVKVNGEVVDVSAEFGLESSSSLRYYDWIEVAVATIDLKTGTNVIEFIKNDNDRGLNFDYIVLYGLDQGEILDPREANGHSYDWTFVTLPTYEAAGSVYGYCKYCRDKLDTIDLPVISAENGYTKLSSGVMSRWEYSINGHKLYVDVPEESQKYMFDVSATEDIFSKVVDNNGIGDGSAFYNTNKQKNSYGWFYELTQGATFTLEVTVEEAADVVFILRLRSTANTTFKCGEIINSISVVNNGQAIASEIRNDNVTFQGWAPENTVDAELAVLSLQPGKNTITFTMNNLNINISGVGFGAFVPVELVPVTVYGGTINTFDPFAAENGGTHIDNDTTSGAVHGLVNAGTSNALYQNLRNSVLSFTVYVEEATTIRFRLGLAFNKSAGYATTSIATITSTNANGQANSVALNSITAKNTKWTVADAVIIEFATIELAAGENTITIAMGANNINITGVYVSATKEVILGKK